MNEAKQLFSAYRRHYSAGNERHFIDPAYATSIGKDRVPSWMHALGRDAMILDAGCADGYMLAALIHAGFHRLTGVDISDEMASLARGRLGSDAHIITAPIGDFLKRSDMLFDVILLHHVIEHVQRDQTIALLRLLYDRLAPGGYLSIRTPNANALGAGYHCLGDFTHVVAFNERSLLQVLEHAGFLPCDIVIVPKKPRRFISIRHPLRMLARTLNRVRWTLNRLFHRAIYLLGDLQPLPTSFDWELEVLARKATESAR